jgi:primosomal protein N' (replication factor Y)
VPAGTHVAVGDVVRIALHGRRVGGWVVDTDAEPPAGVALRPLAKRSGVGPAPEVIDLARWAAWRWAGRRASFLRTAAPPTVVAAVPRRDPPPGPVPAVPDPLVDAALAGPDPAVLRLPPAADVFGVVLAAAARGQALVVAPSLATARHLALRLRRAGVDAALHPRDWARAAAGATVVGARAAAWAPAPELAAVVVVDEHDEAHQEERAPTWHAREVAVERARRAGVPCVLTSPVPSLEALGHGRLLAASRGDERAGWPILDVVDRRHDDPVRGGLWSERLVPRLRADGTVLCVLNRTGRARLLACAACGELARCARCEAAVAQDDAGLACGRCGEVRPAVCQACGASRLKQLRIGVTRAREELEALLGEPVVEVTGATADRELPEARVYVGTEAVLHQVPAARVVAFLDVDQELLAPRYRAAEQALALVARAARLLGPRADGGRLVAQTRLPHHEVLDAVLKADPGRLAATDDERRRALGFPPHSALAEISGAAASAFVEGLGRPPGVDVLGPDAAGRFLLRAPDHRRLCDTLAAATRPAGRLRVAVDPPRV